MCKAILAMIAAVAFILLTGASAVFGDDRTCAQVQQAVLADLRMYQFGAVIPIDHSNFDIIIEFERVKDDKEIYGETILIVKPCQSLPTITINDTSYKLNELSVTKVDTETAYLTVVFSESPSIVYESAVNIFVPLTLTENNEHPKRNPWLTTDLTMMSNLPYECGHKINSMYWLHLLLMRAIRLTSDIKSFEYLMTDCQTVPTYSVKEFNEL